MRAKKALWIPPMLVAFAMLICSGDARTQNPPAKTKAQAAKPPSYVSATPPQVRMRWQDFIGGPGGSQRLNSLKTAIKKMKSLDSSPKNSADYRRSWEYWANIHGYYGTQSPDGTVQAQIQYLRQNGMGNYVSYYTGITDQTPPDATAKLIWATCQHSNPPQQANFFAWHRMYLYYFERVLRWAANDNTLRLPYWDYTDPAHLAVPAEFRNTSSAFYDAKRDPGMNSGSSTLDSNETDVNSLLPISNYFKYESQIEEGIHGYVHCTVGPTCPVAHMGDVPVAGNDPVFYSHHDNIDRLWACWQKLHPTPAGTWQTQKFSFVDETGALVTKAVKEFVDTAKLGYVYDNETSCGRPGTLLLTARIPGVVVAIQNTVMLGASPAVPIKGPLTSIDIPVPKGRILEPLKHLEKAEAMELVLRDVTADSHPGVLFNVYLAKKGDPGSRQRIGTISWFGAFHHRGRHAGPEKKTLTYDVTRALQALGGPAVADSGGVTVMIEATSGRVPADQSKAEQEKKLAGAAFRTESNLRIGAVELRTAPPTTK
jgi:hypothetical protein